MNDYVIFAIFAAIVAALMVICTLVILRAPAQKSHIIDHCLCYKALVNEILKGGMTASLAELLVSLIGDERAMDVYRLLPSKGLIKPGIFR